MHILLIRTKLGISYARKIQAYLLSRSIHCVISDIPNVDAVIRAEGLRPEETLIHSRTAGKITNKKIAELERKGFRVINSSKTLTLTNNKYLAQRHAKENNIPIAKTYKIAKSNIKKIKQLLDTYKSLVLKPIYSQGQGIYCYKITLRTTEKKFREIIGKIPGDWIQVQECVDYKKLIRIIVINYKTLTQASTYDIPSGSWKCSVCLNPKVKKYYHRGARGRELAKLAERTAKAFEAQVNFIDFFEKQDGNFILNEINTACSLHIHEYVTGCRISEFIGDYLAKEAKKLPRSCSHIISTDGRHTF